MAIDYNSAAYLLSAKSRGIPFGRVLMLGRQHLSLSPEMIASLEQQFNTDLQAFVRGEGEERFAEGFFEFLGADEITAMDFSDYEQSSLVHDLNEPIPDEWKGKYDMVVDGGTLEHVFNFPCAVRNAMELVAEGGHFYGSNPADHWIGHGFYQFSPELFFRVFSEENGFEIVDVILAEDMVGGAIHKVKDPAEAGTRIALEPKTRVASVVMAKKTRQVDQLFKSTPQQSDYTVRWEGEGESSGETSQATGLKGLIKKLLPASVVRKIQAGAIAKKHAAEGARGLTQLTSMNELK